MSPMELNKSTSLYNCFREIYDSDLKQSKHVSHTVALILEKANLGWVKMLKACELKC